MNTELLKCILKHILSNLLIIQSDFVDQQKTNSLMSKEFLLSKKLSLEVEDETISVNVWGCQLSAEDRELKILVTDLSQSKSINEYCLLVQLKNTPAYGCYLVKHNKVFDSPMMACNVDKIGWMECNTYLQATFLAGMEQIKDINFKWNKCSHYQDQFDLLKSFINYYDSVYEEKDEG